MSDHKIIKEIFTYMADAILIIDDESTIIYCNQAFCDLLGYGVDEVIGEDLTSLLALDIPGIDHSELVAKFINSEKPGIGMKSRSILQCLNSRGEFIPVKISLSRLLSGDEKLGLGIIHDFTGVTDALMEQQQLARTDALTGVYNRRFFEELVVPESHTLKGFEQFGIIFIDLDKFKVINDENGHDGGDELLKIIGQRLKNTIRDSDIICRVGGDEFVFFALNIGSKSRLRSLAEKIHQTITRPIHISGKAYNVGASLGACLYPDHGTDMGQLINLADETMYRAKRNGGGVELPVAGNDE